MNYKTAVLSVGVTNSVDPDQDQRSVGPDLDGVRQNIERQKIEATINRRDKR